MTTAMLPKQPGRLFTGNLKEILNNPLEFLNEQYPNNSEMARFKAGPIDVYSIGEPELVRKILTDKSIEKVELNRKLFFPVIGNGLLASEGELWRKQRKSISHLFRPKRLGNYQALMRDPVKEFVSGLTDTNPTNLTEGATLVTIQILVRSIFGLENNFSVGDLEKHLEILANQFVKRVSSIVQYPLWLPTPNNRIMNKSTVEVLRIVKNLIDSHDQLSLEDSQNTLIQALRSAEDEHGNKMSEQQIFDEVATFFLAGHEATSTTLQWAVYNLSKHKDKQENLHLELAENLDDEIPKKDSLENLTYLKAVIDETLRLFPTCYVQTRQVSSDNFYLNGFKLKKGSIIVVPVYAMHRNPNWYPEPEEFQPERWLNGSTDGLQKLAFMPFGGGKRVCIGEHFSRYELMTLLASIYRNKRSSIPEGHTQPGIFPAVTLRPTNDMYINFTLR